LGKCRDVATNTLQFFGTAEICASQHAEFGNHRLAHTSEVSGARAVVLPDPGRWAKASMTASDAVALETKRRRVCPPSRVPFEGETLAALLEHLERDAPCVRVEALDALGAPVPRDSKETPLEDAAESIRVTAEGAFVARIEGLGGAARLETLMAGPPGDDMNGAKTKQTETGWSVASVVVSASPVTGEDDKAEGEKPNAHRHAHGRASRAHELLSLRAREVLAAAANEGDETKTKENKADGSGAKKNVLAAIYALVSFFDNLHDVFTAPDPSNFGRIFAPDLNAGGTLVPSRLLVGANP
jgi:hypothetical protein